MTHFTDSQLNVGGRLLVVGTGIRSVAHLTAEAEGAIRESDVVLCAVQNAMAQRSIEELNPRTESLLPYYREGVQRDETYRAMVERILELVRSGKRVCAALYGHPGVFAVVGHEAVRKTREEGLLAEMLPGISAEDCLFSDLGIDPGDYGCQSFEATDFLVRHRVFDTTSHLLLWQVGALGKMSYQRGESWDPPGISLLVERLEKEYGDGHQVTLYESPTYSCCLPGVRTVKLSELAGVSIGIASTIYVPPLSQRPVDLELLRRMRSSVG